MIPKQIWTCGRGVSVLVPKRSVTNKWERILPPPPTHRDVAQHWKQGRRCCVPSLFTPLVLRSYEWNRTVILLSCSPLTGTGTWHPRGSIVRMKTYLTRDSLSIIIRIKLSGACLHKWWCWTIPPFNFVVDIVGEHNRIRSSCVNSIFVVYL